MGRIIIGFCVVLLIVVGMMLKYEQDYPCLEYGPERLQYMQKVGGTFVPIYGADCLRRATP